LPLKSQSYWLAPHCCIFSSSGPRDVSSVIGRAGFAVIVLKLRR
jgi:hypothetical protein